MATLVKRQHFVPQTYLKHFGIVDGEEVYIKVLPKEENTVDGIFDSNIKNVALKKHLYTLPGDTTEEKMVIERFYSENLEVHYNRIYEILTNKSINRISPEDRELIITTVVTMYYRTTWWINQHFEVMSRVFEQQFELCKQTGKDYYMFEGVKHSISSQTLEEHLAEYKNENQPSMIFQQLHVASKLISLRIRNDKICVYKLSSDRTELITSDNPVTAVNILQDNLVPFDPQNILSLPLDSEHILYLIPDNDTHERNSIYRTEFDGSMGYNEIIISNYEQAKLSERFIFGSKTSLEK